MVFFVLIDKDVIIKGRKPKMNIEKQIEFDKIKEKWMELAITDQAKDQIRNISFYLSELELRRRIQQTAGI